jgi:hypothetical protein
MNACRSFAKANNLFYNNEKLADAVSQRLVVEYGNSFIAAKPKLVDTLEQWFLDDGKLDVLASNIQTFMKHYNQNPTSDSHSLFQTIIGKGL